MVKVISIGNTCLDLVLRYGRRLPAWGTEAFFDEAEWRLGGQGANFAVATSKLELRTQLVSSIGANYIGQQFASELRSIRFLDTEFLRVEETDTGFSVTLVRRDGERLFLTFLGHQKAYSLSKDIGHLLDRIDKDDFVHVSGYHMLPSIQTELPTILSNIKLEGARVSFDPGWNPAGLDAHEREKIYRLLSHVDYFGPNQVELSALTGALTTASGIKKLKARYSGVIIVKLGRRGSMTVDQDGSATNVRTVPIRALDTVGAGDVFDAGFISGMIQGHSLQVSARIGNAAAALAISKTGPSSHRFPTRLEVDSLLKEGGM